KRVQFPARPTHRADSRAQTVSDLALAAVRPLLFGLRYQSPRSPSSPPRHGGHFPLPSSSRRMAPDSVFIISPRECQHPRERVILRCECESRISGLRPENPNLFDGKRRLTTIL